MNEHDSERMKGMLEALGYGEAEGPDSADLLLFNTCSIREKADTKFVTHLRQAAARKRQRPGVVIGVGGCWAQSVKDQVFEDYPFVDVAFGPGQVHKLAEFLKAGGKAFLFYTVPGPIRDLIGVNVTGSRRQDAEGQFAQMRFSHERPAGFPARRRTV